MKMSHKLMILFSLLTILTTFINATFFYSSKVRDLTISTNQLLNAIGSKTVNEFERYVQLMDGALDSLLANPDFEKALQRLEAQSTPEAHQSIQEHLMQAVAQEPVATRFYRIIVYTQDGFFFSSRADNGQDVENFSEKVQMTINADGWIDRINAAPGQRHLIEAHRDPWDTTKFMGIFSRVHPYILDGNLIAYIQVDAHLMDIDHLFTLKDMEGLRVQIMFDNGIEFFGAHHGRDLFVSAYEDDSGLMHLKMKDGSERVAISLASETLPVVFQLSQDMPFFDQQIAEILRHCMITLLSILLVTLLLIAMISMGLTRSIRRLTQKVSHLPADNLLAQQDETAKAIVTSPQDRETYQLELVFNDLMERLRTSMRNEIVMREGTLHARLSALQMQINPHFIYNTLNIISAKGLELGSQEITDLCDQFAQMLRYATDLRSQSATLGDELQNARCYLMLVKARYEEDLEYTIDVPEEMNSLLLPKLSLQPVIENALTHGFTGRAGRREIHLTGTLEDDTMHLVIRDNGRGFAPGVLQQLQEAFRQIEQDAVISLSSSGEHLGLVNTYLRLHHYSKGCIRMHLYNNCGAVVVLTCVKNKSRPKADE